MDSLLLQRTSHQTPPSKVITKILSRPQQKSTSTDAKTNLKAGNRIIGNIETQKILPEQSSFEKDTSKVILSSSYNKSKTSWIHSKKKFLGGFKLSTIKENEICSENYQPVTKETQPMETLMDRDTPSPEKSTNPEGKSTKTTGSEVKAEKKSLRKILQQRDMQQQAKTEDSNQVRHNANTQLMKGRFSELARSIAGTSSTTNLVAGGSMTTSSGQEVSSSMFGNQVRAPKETRVPNGAQTGAAAPSKNIKADNDFKGNHVKPPIHPPSSGPAMSAELERIFSAVQSEDRQRIMREEIQREEEQAAREDRPPPWRR